MHKADKLYLELKNFIGYSGAMLDMDKSSYAKENPDHVVFYNACIFNMDGYEIWCGDFDLTANEKKLVEFVDKHGSVLFVTRESYRFDGLKKSLEHEFYCIDELNFRNEVDGAWVVDLNGLRRPEKTDLIGLPDRNMEEV